MPCLILPGGKLEWNVPYLKSIPGVLGIAEVALNAIVFLCAISSGQCFRSQSYMIWPELVGAIGFWIALSLLLLQLIRGSREAVIERLSQLTKVVHWFMIEGALTALGCFVYLTIFLDCAVASTRTYTCFEYIPIYNIRSPAVLKHDGGVLGVTAFFAFVATVAYGVDSYLKFQDYRSSNQNTETAQEKTDPYQMEIPV